MPLKTLYSVLVSYKHIVQTRWSRLGVLADGYGHFLMEFCRYRLRFGRFIDIYNFPLKNVPTFCIVITCTKPLDPARTNCRYVILIHKSTIMLLKGCDLQTKVVIKCYLNYNECLWHYHANLITFYRCPIS